MFRRKRIIPDASSYCIATADAWYSGRAGVSAPKKFGVKRRSDVRRPPAIIKPAVSTIPFPAADDLQKQRIRVVAEDLDAHRKRVLADHPHSDPDGLYNVLEKLQRGRHRTPRTRRPPIFDDGLVLILKDLHDKLDAAVADAYGWPVDLSDDEFSPASSRSTRSGRKEEARGIIRWLRPDYQIPRFGSPKEKAELDLVGGGMATRRRTGRSQSRPSLPKNLGRTAAVMSALASAPGRCTPTPSPDLQAGPQSRAKVTTVLAALALVGFVDSDGRRQNI